MLNFVEFLTVYVVIFDVETASRDYQIGVSRMTGIAILIFAANQGVL